MEIKVKENNIEGALKVLKNKLNKDSLFKEIKRRKSYEKPSEKEKRKRTEARKKRSKARRTKSLVFRKTSFKRK